jgi:hypothetical protein
MPLLLAVALLAPACGRAATGAASPPAPDDPTVSTPGDDGGGAPGGAEPIRPRGDALDPRPAALVRYRAADRGRALVLFFYSGPRPCHALDRVEVQERKRVVRVALLVGRDKDAGDVACPEIAQLFKTTVTLRGPLAGRRVVGVE